MSRSAIWATTKARGGGSGWGGRGDLPLRLEPFGARQTLQLGCRPVRSSLSKGWSPLALQKLKSSGTGRKSLSTSRVGPCTRSIQSVSWPALATVAESATSCTEGGQWMIDSSQTVPRWESFM